MSDRPEETRDHARDPRRDAILSVTIEGGHFSAGVVTFRGELLDRTRADVDPDVGPQSHFASLARMVTEQRDRAREQHNVRVRAIGVGCAGPIERNCETVSPASVPSWRRFELRQHLRELTQKTCPEAVEGFGYGMPGYKYRGRPLIYFASFKNHMSIFAAGYEGINRHRAELTDYEIKAGTIHFQASKPLPDKLFRALIKGNMADIDARVGRTPARKGRA